MTAKTNGSAPTAAQFGAAHAGRHGDSSSSIHLLSKDKQEILAERAALAFKQVPLADQATQDSSRISYLDKIKQKEEAMKQDKILVKKLKGKQTLVADLATADDADADADEVDSEEEEQQVLLSYREARKRRREERESQIETPAQKRARTMAERTAKRAARAELREKQAEMFKSVTQAYLSNDGSADTWFQGVPRSKLLKLIEEDGEVDKPRADLSALRDSKHWEATVSEKGAIDAAKSLKKKDAEKKA